MFNEAVPGDSLGHSSSLKPMTNLTAYGAASIAAMEKQTASLLSAFHAFGAERIEPAIVQPADAFLDRMGEELRSRTCVFTGPDGNELCLRPDLTIPTAQLYLAHTPACDRAMKLCYAGPVFRHDPTAPNQTGQSLQAGVECFNTPATPDIDVEIVMLAHKALTAAGLSQSTLTIGDVGLFRALLEALRLPPHWISRIRRHAWHRERLYALLQRYAGAAPQDNRFVASLKDHTPEHAREVLRDALGMGGIRIIGTRSFDEIADRFLEKAAESASARLAPEAADLIQSFLALQAPAAGAVEAIRTLCKRAGVNVEGPLSDLSARLSRLAAAGLDPAKVTFAGQFGRNMEYYTGFVFEVRADGVATPVAGGGRYDDLLTALGAPKQTPSVGLAIFCDRLASSVSGKGARP